MVAMNRVRQENQTASTPLATKVARESPQELRDLLNLCWETDRYLDNLLKETNPHLNNPPANEPVDDPEVTVEEKEKDHNEMKENTDKSSLPAAPKDNSTKAAPAGTESVSASRSGNTRQNRTRSHEKERNTEKRRTSSKKTGPSKEEKKSSKPISTASTKTKPAKAVTKPGVSRTEPVGPVTRSVKHRKNDKTEQPLEAAGNIKWKRTRK